MDLYLLNIGRSRLATIEMWHNGRAFHSLDGDIVVTIRKIDELRIKYKRILIQYDKGVVEV